MVKYLSLLLIIFPLFLWAQETPELIELDLDNIEYRAWEELYETLLSKHSHIGMDNRIWLDDNSYSLHSMRFDYEEQKLYFNYRNDWKPNLSHANFCLKISRNQLFEEMAMGHYRIRFGTGNTLGSGSKDLKADVISIQKPPQPQRYTPFGAAAKFGFKHFSGTIFGSVTNREVKLDANGKIKSLPKTRTGLTDSSSETLYGAAVSYQAKLFRLGILGYAQDYEKDFAAAGLNRRSSVFSLYGALRLKEHWIDLESGAVNDKPHHFLAWNYFHQGFQQSFSLAVDPDARQLAYFTPREALSRDPNTMELAWDARFPLFRDARLFARFAFDQNTKDHINTKGMKKRLLAAFDYQPKDRHFRFGISHFDKEILNQTGEGQIDYSVTRPDHWRIQINYTDQVLPFLQLLLNSRYHIENKDTWRDNAFYYHSALKLDAKRLSLRFGYQGWQNAKTGVYYEDETASAWSLATREDQNLYLAADWALKNIKLGLNLRQSLRKSKDQRLILNLGTWL